MYGGEFWDGGGLGGVVLCPGPEGRWRGGDADLL